MHLDRYLMLRSKLLNGFEKLVSQAQQSGEIKATEDPEVISRSLFFVLAASIRWWLASSSRPEWREGMRDFDRLMQLQNDGLVHASSERDKAF